MIQLYHVYKSYGPHTYALNDVSLDISPGEFVFLTGPSGAGKSTLLRLFFCAERANRGQVMVWGRNLSRLAGRGIAHLRRNIGVVFQDYKLLPRRTVFENVALALEVQGMRAQQIQKRTQAILEHVDLREKARSYPLHLSGGEQQRVALARALVVEPKIILADEPTGNLDQTQGQNIMRLIEESNQRGATVIIATHDRSLLGQHKRRALHLVGGRLQESVPW